MDKVTDFFKSSASSITSGLKTGTDKLIDGVKVGGEKVMDGVKVGTDKISGIIPGTHKEGEKAPGTEATQVVTAQPPTTATPQATTTTVTPQATTTTNPQGKNQCVSMSNI